MEIRFYLLSGWVYDGYNTFLFLFKDWVGNMITRSRIDLNEKAILLFEILEDDYDWRAIAEFSLFRGCY